jgi:hypothetical protein
MEQRHNVTQKLHVVLLKTSTLLTMNGLPDLTTQFILLSNYRPHSQQQCQQASPSSCFMYNFYTKLGDSPWGKLSAGSVSAAA